MLENISYYPNDYLFLYLLGGFILIIGLLIREKRNIPLPKYDWVPLFCIPFSVLVLLFFIFTKDAFSGTEILISMIVFILHHASFLFLYEQITKLIERSVEQQVEAKQQRFYEHQVEMMKKSLEDMQEIRHDMKNKLLALSGAASTGRYDELVNSISDAIEECCREKEYAHSGNAVIDSIIEYKLQQSKGMNIRFSADMMIPEELECMVFDLGIVIGNLLDNAIEAVEKEKDRWIDLKMEYTKGRLMLKIRNPYSGSLCYKDNQIMTEKEDSKNHGLGLKSVKKVVQKYNGLLEVCPEHHIFEVKILMYLA